MRHHRSGWTHRRCENHTLVPSTVVRHWDNRWVIDVPAVGEAPQRRLYRARRGAVDEHDRSARHRDAARPSGRRR